MSVRLVYKSQDGVVENGMRALPAKYVHKSDSLKAEALAWEYFNHRGLYMKALEKVKNHSPLINEYYNKKATVGELDSRLFCDMILSNNPDFSDYLVKRIIIIELINKYAS